MEEVWRDILNYEGLYQVSNLGRVRSLDRYVKGCHGKQFIRGRILTLTKAKHATVVSLYQNNSPQYFDVGRLVAGTFLGLDYNSAIYHLDGDIYNNTLENLTTSLMDDSADEEVWKTVKGTNDKYMISSKGRILSVSRDFQNPKYRNVGHKKSKFIKTFKTKNGYLRASVQYKGKNKLIFVHRLVAEAFIPNPENKETVNHIDGNKENNCVENLEWCTSSENTTHAHKTGLNRHHTRIQCLETNEIFYSYGEAARKFNVSRDIMMRRVKFPDKPSNKLKDFHFSIIESL